MYDTDWEFVFVNGAAIVCFIMVGLVLLVGACVIIGKEIADRSPRPPLVIPESVDEKFEFAGHPDYAGLRRQILRAEEAAGMQ